MNNPYANLPPPPDGFGDWHYWDAEAFREEAEPENDYDIPSFLLPNDKVSYIMADESNSGTPEPAAHLIWLPYGEGTIKFFCLPHDHPYNHYVPNPPEPTPLDTTGMDSAPMWGMF